MFLVWAAFSLPALWWVLPALDDWRTAAPISGLSWDLLRPGLFWRPLDRLLRALLEHVPWAHTHLLHLLVVAGHGLSGWQVYRLAAKAAAPARTARNIAAWAAIIFLCSPAVGAAVWSLDSAVQTWSTALGLLAARVYLSSPASRPKTAGWILLCLASLLWKESGLAWLLVCPLLPAALGLPPSPRRVLPGLLLGVAVLAGYLGLRLTLSLPAPLLDAHSPYHLLVNPLVWLRNGAMLLGVAGSTVDTLALLGSAPWPALAALSALAGLLLPGLLLLSLHQCWSRGRKIAALLVLALVLGPHLPLARVSEMYAHPLTAALAVLLAGAAPHIPATRRRWLATALAFFLIAAVAVDAHKLLSMVRTGEGAIPLGAQVAAAAGKEAPKKICAVVHPAAEDRGYSVFQAAPAPASGWGLAARPHWGWSRPVGLTRVRAPDQCPPNHSLLLEFSTPHSVQVIRVERRTSP